MLICDKFRSKSAISILNMLHKRQPLKEFNTASFLIVSLQLSGKNNNLILIYICESQIHIFKFFTPKLEKQNIWKITW